MTRVHASIAAAMLLGIAACSSTPDKDTLDNEIKNLEGLVQSQQSRIDQLTARNAEAEQKLAELEAQMDAKESTKEVIEKAKREISAHAAEIRKRFQADSDVKVELDPAGYRFVMTERVLFTTGSVELTKEGKGALARVAEALRSSNHPAVIEGHTDNVPVAKPETLKKYPRGNIELSVARALAVWDYLKSVGKVPETRLSVAGYGPNRPRAPNDTDFQRWHNRRVEILVAEK